jgi:hypothetical protein
MTSWAFLHGFIHAPRSDRNKKLLFAFFIFSALLPATSRVDATTYIVFTSVVVLFHHYLGSRHISQNEIIGATSLTAIGVAVVMLNQHVRGYLTISNPAGSAFGQYLLFQIVHIPESLVEPFGYSIGQQGSGPGIVGIIGLSLFVVGFSHAMQNSTRQQLLIVLIILSFLMVVMFKGSVLIASLVPLPGQYVLGLLTFLLGMSIITSKSDQQFMTRRGNRRTTISLLSITHALCLFTWMESYIKGSQIPGFFSRQTLGTFYQFNLNGGWWWNTWISPNLVYLLAVASFTSFLVFAWRVVDSDLSITD